LPEELATDPSALRRFEREARAASGLDHPNICTIYDFNEHEGQPFIVMQFLDGQTIRDRMEVGLPFSWVEIAEVAIQVTEGLQVAHQNGIIHRDIKPANIFLTTRGEAKLLDFGIGQANGSH
jgi:eukaryotic-like serine/threonine-protein kinase